MLCKVTHCTGCISANTSMNLISYTGGTTGDCRRLLEATGAHWEEVIQRLLEYDDWKQVESAGTSAEEDTGEHRDHWRLMETIFETVKTIGDCTEH